jgi:cellulose synthase/poly-beta-1,6-N-acetylglucosamine synthase-like glycosyltransferase
MILITEILLYFFFGIAFLYILLLIAYNIAWFRSKTYSIIGNPPKTRVSVIVPARNESENIIKCLESISFQNYPSELFEIIIADDSSTDNTILLVNDFIKKHLLKNIHLIEPSNSNIHYKKQVITEAMRGSKGELIITTDADCIVSPRWISTIVEYYEMFNPVIMVGLVSFYNEKTTFQKLQSLEFLSLIVSGFASIKLGFPIICNGANLAYSKKAFVEVGGYETNQKYASGDDVFLLLKMKKKFPHRITFIKNYDALVKTKPQKSFLDFISQRRRWVSKSSGYRDPGIIITALIIYIFNLSILVSGILSIFNPAYFQMFVFALLTKLLIDFPLLAGISSFVKKKSLLVYYLPLQLIYILYVVIIGITGNIGSYIWKGRKMK